MPSDKTVYRLDKWLWACRFYKTRRLAREMIEKGHVRYHHQRVKPSKAVEIGAIITVRQGDDERTITVLSLVDQRLSAPLSLACYQESEESRQQREQKQTLRKLGGWMPRPDHKPNKQDRRHLIEFKHHFKDPYS